MTKPEDIPQDIWKTVGGDVTRVGSLAYDICQFMARSIMAERERCAMLAESFILQYATSSRDIHVAMQGAAKEDAAAEIAAAIRKGAA